MSGRKCLLHELPAKSPDTADRPPPLIYAAMHSSVSHTPPDGASSFLTVHPCGAWPVAYGSWVHGAGGEGMAAWPEGSSLS